MSSPLNRILKMLQRELWVKIGKSLENLRIKREKLRMEMWGLYFEDFCRDVACRVLVL